MGEQNKKKDYRGVLGPKLHFSLPIKCAQKYEKIITIYEY